jgi:hypothetical protein
MDVRYPGYSVVFIFNTTENRNQHFVQTSGSQTVASLDRGSPDQRGRRGRASHLVGVFGEGWLFHRYLDIFVIYRHCKFREGADASVGDEAPRCADLIEKGGRFH